MSNTLKIDGHTKEAKKLGMFSFTLAEETEEWFYSLPARSITTWEEMEKAFLNEYFPASVFLRKRYEMFVNGLKINTKQLIDTAAGGSTNFSTSSGIKKIIEAIAANEYMELYDRCQSKPEGVIDLKLETTKIRIEDTIAAEVEKKLKAMNIGTRQVAQKNTTTSIKNLEVQMGQIAQQITSSSQAQGVLPSATVPNPREHHNVSVVTTRSGKSEEVIEEVDEEEDQLIKVDLAIKENEVVREEVVAPKSVVKEMVIEPKPVVKLPFPTRNKKKRQHEKNFENFLELFKKLEINIPLLEALEQMPTFSKFMKDIISKKRTANTNLILLTETCSAILQGMKILKKKEDRGAVTIPCTIGDRSFNKALIDLGASVSLMPLSIYKKLSIGAVQDTKMTLQFADH
ncbi:uncharacterized protein LOC127108096 [Lathyrus oleraceus]|uniref:uncharacterized protein LOC127108096 n=1 Tax=Pisum sativum TaxID=3888 RepID=UPI0021D1F265|nr:uncharacterized protein LOC127108096 [Pisum sativum]